MSHHFCAQILAALALATASTPATAAPPEYTIHTLGLTGQWYERESGTGTYYRASVARYINEADQVLGYTKRYGTNGSDLGHDAWIYDGTDYKQVGLVGEDHSYTDIYGTLRLSEGTFLTSSGGALGLSFRYDSSGNRNGVDAWAYDGSTTRLIGLVGDGYEWRSVRNRNNRIRGANDAGQAIGHSRRHAPTGHIIGEDAWYYDGHTTHVIGLLGGEYEYTNDYGTMRYSLPSQITNSSTVLGDSERYGATGLTLGRDAWMFDGATTRRVGLTGAEYQYTTSEGVFRNAWVRPGAGDATAAGVTVRYGAQGQSLGQDTWRDDGASSELINPIGAGYQYTTATGTYRYSEVYKINGQNIVGITYRYSANGDALGRDGWLADDAGTHVLALTGEEHEHQTAAGTRRQSFVSHVNAAGDANGTSVRYDSSGNSVGSDAWLYKDGAMHRIGLEGGQYDNEVAGGTERAGFLMGLNEAGQVIGYSTRYIDGQQRGRTGWFYDPITDQTSELEFSVYANGYSWSLPELLTESGEVLGRYELYDGTNALGQRAFYWSVDRGFLDLGSLAGNFAEENWSYLRYVSGINGAGSIIGAGARHDTTGDAAYLLTVPEPATVAALAFAAPMLVRRRSRR